MPIARAPLKPVKGRGSVQVGGVAPVVALSAERLKEWMAADLSKLDLLIIQIDGGGVKHPLGVLEGATENTAVVQGYSTT